MTRHEMMRRMSGQEFAAWGAFFTVKAEEDKAARDALESPDGQVVITGRDRPDDDEDDEIDDGEAEQRGGD